MVDFTRKYLKNFFTVEARFIRDSEPVPFGLYVHLPINQKLVRLKQESTIIDEGFSEKYITRGLTYFHIQKSQERELEEYLKRPLSEKELTQAAATAATTPVAASVVPAPRPIAPLKPQEAPFQPTPQATPPPPTVETSPAFEAKLKETLKGLDSKDERDRAEAVTQARKIVKDVVLLAENPQSLFSEAWDASLEAGVGEHSINVCTFAVMFGLGLGMKDRNLLKEIALAGLIHDLGVTQVPYQHLRHDEDQRPEESLAPFQAHVPATLQLVKTLRVAMPEHSIKTIAQQHEKFDGTGFPLKLRNWDIGESAQILSMADLFETMLSGTHDSVKHPIGEAFSIISKVEKSRIHPERFNPSLFNKLLKWIESGTGTTIADESRNLATDLAGSLLTPETA